MVAFCLHNVVYVLCGYGVNALLLVTTRTLGIKASEALASIPCVPHGHFNSALVSYLSIHLIPDKQVTRLAALLLYSFDWRQQLGVGRP